MLFHCNSIMALPPSKKHITRLASWKIVFVGKQCVQKAVDGCYTIHRLRVFHYPVS